MTLRKCFTVKFWVMAVLTPWRHAPASRRHNGTSSVCPGKREARALLVGPTTGLAPGELKLSGAPQRALQRAGSPNVEAQRR